MTHVPQPTLDVLKTNDELPSKIAAKYGVDKAIAQRGVDTLMAHRTSRCEWAQTTPQLRLPGRGWDCARP
jgi:hypothetical protein